MLDFASVLPHDLLSAADAASQVAQSHDCMLLCRWGLGCLHHPYKRREGRLQEALAQDRGCVLLVHVRKKLE